MDTVPIVDGCGSFFWECMKDDTSPFVSLILTVARMYFYNPKPKTLKPLGTQAIYSYSRKPTKGFTWRSTHNLLSNCSYDPIISWVTVVMELIFRS